MKRGYRFSAGLLTVLCFAAVTACTTATYGETFQPYGATQGIYRIKIYIGGIAGLDAAEQRLDKETIPFMQANGFTSYNIVDDSYNFIPSYYLFTVRFNRASP